MNAIKSNFSVTHRDDLTFKTEGLRDYFEYRDLGIKESTKGAMVAHIIRAAKPFDGGGTGLHRHDCEFQFVYVLNGWARFQFEGQGEVTIRAGSCVNQPPGIKHILIEYSDDFEVLELVAPADYGTEDLGKGDAKAAAE